MVSVSEYFSQKKNLSDYVLQNHQFRDIFYHSGKTVVVLFLSHLFVKLL